MKIINYEISNVAAGITRRMTSSLYTIHTPIVVIYTYTTGCLNKLLLVISKFKCNFLCSYFCLGFNLTSGKQFLCVFKV